MTTDQTTHEQPQDAQEQTIEQEATESPDTSSKAGKEAAKYRRQLRDTEAERDTLKEQVTGLRKHIAETLSGLTKPSALWAAGVEVDDLLNEDGHVDPTKVKEAVEHAADTLGLSRTPRPDRSQGTAGFAPPSQRDMFAQAFGPQR